MEFNLKKILRALLLSTSEPLSIKDIQAVITRHHQEAGPDDATLELAPEPAPVPEPEPLVADGEAPPPVDQGMMKELIVQVPALVTATQIREAMDAIALELDASGEPCRLVQGPNGYRLAIAPEYASWVRLLRQAPKPLKLSQASLETLALIAYRQPITRAEIEAVRGVASDSALNTLLELEMVHISGRADLPGRPIQYATTSKFLEFCGVRSVEELPATDVISPAQLGEWIRRATQPGEQPELLTDADVGLPSAEPVLAPATPAEGAEGEWR